MPGVRLAGAHLVDVIWADAFDCNMAVALSADGAYLGAATTDGEVRAWRVADRTLASLWQAISVLPGGSTERRWAAAGKRWL
jgi:hypothetical protein